MNNNNFSQKENVLLVGVIYGELDEEKVCEHLDELSLLCLLYTSDAADE